MQRTTGQTFTARLGSGDNRPEVGINPIIILKLLSPEAIAINLFVQVD